MLSFHDFVSLSHVQIVSVVPTTAHQPFSPTGTAAFRASGVAYHPCAPMVMVRTCSKYSLVPCKFFADSVSDVFALLSLVAAAAALDAALSEYSFKSALTSFAALVAACSAFALSDVAVCAAVTASSFALIAPATVLSSFKVAALIGVPSFVGSSFRTRVMTSDAPSGFTIVHRPGYFATRSSKTILALPCHVLSGKSDVCFGNRFYIRQNAFNLIHCFKRKSVHGSRRCCYLRTTGVFHSDRFDV